MNVQSPERFRANLRRAMEAKGISQRIMAERAGVSYPYINRILMGKVAPSLPQADAIADAVGVPLPKLLLSVTAFQRSVLTTVSGTANV